MRKLILRNLRDILLRIMILLDVMTNRLFNGRIETISSRAGRARASGRTWGCILCRLLDDIDPGHCDEAIKNPLGRLD